jgi:hypothetical protein
MEGCRQDRHFQFDLNVKLINLNRCELKKRRKSYYHGYYICTYKIKKNIVKHLSSVTFTLIRELHVVMVTPCVYCHFSPLSFSSIFNPLGAKPTF